MRIAVAGGTGLVGGYTVGALEQAGHEVVVLARSEGVDLLSGKGLEPALAGVEAVVDVTSTASIKATETRKFFGSVTGNLLESEARAGIEHHVALSIVNVDRVAGNGHYNGKRLQEELVTSGSVPHTILRATQFHEFAGMVAGWMRVGSLAFVPKLHVQPVAAREVGDALAEIAVGEPQGRARDLGGRKVEDFVDMARRTAKIRREEVRVLPLPSTRLFGKDMSGDALLPGAGARLAATTFEEWLDEVGAAQRPGLESRMKG